MSRCAAVMASSRSIAAAARWTTSLCSAHRLRTACGLEHPLLALAQAHAGACDRAECEADTREQQRLLVDHALATGTRFVERLAALLAGARQALAGAALQLRALGMRALARIVRAPLYILRALAEALLAFGDVSLDAFDGALDAFDGALARPVRVSVSATRGRDRWRSALSSDAAPPTKSTTDTGLSRTTSPRLRDELRRCVADGPAALHDLVEQFARREPILEPGKRVDHLRSDREHAGFDRCGLGMAG